MNMMYEFYQAERPKSLREQRDEDAQRGELAAALSGMRRELAIRLHLVALRRRERNPAPRRIGKGAEHPACPSAPAS